MLFTKEDRRFNLKWLVLVGGLVVFLVGYFGLAPQAVKGAGTVTDCTQFGTIGTAGTLADALNGGGTVTFNCSGTIVMPQTTISANTVISGNGTNRLFVVDSGGLTIDGITLTKGAAADDGGAIVVNNAAAPIVINNSVLSQNESKFGNGGAIFSIAAVTLTNSTINNNSAYGNGGGITAKDGTRVNITSSTISNNIAKAASITGYGGGGIYLEFFSTLNMLNSTINNNTSMGGGGGVYSREGSPLNISNSTIFSNTSNGIFLYSLNSGSNIINLSNVTIYNNTSGVTIDGFDPAAITLINSLIAKNTFGDFSKSSLVSVNYLSLGYNLIGDGSGLSIGTGDLVGTVANPIDPKLGTLADNGGTTKTLLPLAGSLVINAGNPAGCKYISSGTNSLFSDGATITKDQRGVDRPQGGRCDIGAVEVQNTGTIALLPSTYRLAQTQSNASPNVTAKLTSTGANPSIGNSSTIQLTAWGAGGIPTNATGIVGVLTNVSCDRGANFRFWTGNTVPLASNLNVPGANSALNLSTGFTAPLDANGKVYLGLGSGATTTCGYVVDVVGYLTNPDATSNTIALLPTGSYRLAQTQSNASPNFNAKLTSTGANPSAGNSSTVQITAWGQGGIPTNATGIVGVLTNVGCDKGGNFRFWTGAIVPTASNLNVPGAFPALNLSTNFIAPLDSAGKFYLGLGSGATANCGFVVDVVGYIAPAGVGSNVNLLSGTVRVVTTQANASPSLSSNGANPTAGNSSTLPVNFGTVNGLPADAKGVLGVLTNLSCTGGANFRFWTGATVPFASNLNVPGASFSLNLSTGFLAPLETAKVYVGLGSGATTSCGYVVDAIGYIK